MPIPQAAVEQLGVDKEHVVMIGDDIVSDVGGAQAINLSFILAVEPIPLRLCLEVVYLRPCRCIVPVISYTVKSLAMLSGGRN